MDKMSDNPATNPVPNPEAVVELAHEGKKSVSWKNDVVIMARLALVADRLLKGKKLVEIAEEFKCGMTTVVRDLKRVKQLWREQAAHSIEESRLESIAQYKQVIAEAYDTFRLNNHKSPAWLEVIMAAQSHIDEIQGANAPRELMIGVGAPVDIEAVRQKRWDAVKASLEEVLDEEEGDENA
jgi:hypothetical protein